MREADLALDKCIQISQAIELFKERTRTTAGVKQLYRVSLKGPRGRMKIVLVLQDVACKADGNLPSL